MARSRQTKTAFDKAAFVYDRDVLQHLDRVARLPVRSGRAVGRADERVGHRLAGLTRDACLRHEHPRGAELLGLLRSILVGQVDGRLVQEGHARYVAATGVPLHLPLRHEPLG